MGSRRSLFAVGALVLGLLLSPPLRAADEDPPADPAEEIGALFESGENEAVVEQCPAALKTPKLSPDSRAKLMLWNAEALIRLSKFAEAEKALQQAAAGVKTLQSRRAAEILKVLKPALPAGEIDGESLSDPAVLDKALFAAGESLEAETEKLIDETKFDADKAESAMLRSSTDPKRSKLPWARQRDKVTENLDRLHILRPDRAKELASKFAEDEAKVMGRCVRNIRRDLSRSNPLDQRMSYWGDSGNITMTNWRKVQDGVKECVPRVLGLKASAYWLGQAVAFPERYGADPVDSAVPPHEADSFAENAATLLDNIMKNGRPTIDQVDGYRDDWEMLGAGAGDDEDETGEEGEKGEKSKR